MTYTNSPLVNYTKISPNRTSPRNNTVDRITPHCYVGQVSVESMAGWLCNSSAQASANYGIGQDGRVGLFVAEQDRSWCSSSGANDNRAITIECASDSSHPYAINENVYNKLLDLMTDICQRYGKKKLLWFGDKDKTLAYKPAPDEMVITVHRWFANKACPGDYIYARLGKIAQIVTQRLNDNGLSARGVPKSKNDFIQKVASIATHLYKDTGILPSVVIAQCCLETGYGLGADALELVKRNNLLGMKAELLNETWKSYSVWNGESFSKITPEVYNGKTRYKPDLFRIYTDYENCILDYEMFLLHVMSGGQYKYRKVIAMTNPKDVITTISKGGYATDPLYITKVLKIIEENNLTVYDAQVGVAPDVSLTIHTVDSVPEIVSDGYYRVQIGAFSERANARKFAKKVQQAGFSTVIKKVDNIYKVQVGAYKLWENANKKLNEVKSAGFTDAFIS